MKLSHYVGAVLIFAVARFGTMEETVTATQPGSALLSLAPQPFCLPLEGKMPLAADEV